MPKLGMGPIRREQICRAATTLLAREGFAGTTMRMVAEEAGVSTGMLNHYFENRLDLLTQALSWASERSLTRYRAAIESVPPGRGRLEALIDDMLAGDPEGNETWRVWINAYGESLREPEMRRMIQQRLVHWFALLDDVLEGLAPEPAEPTFSMSYRLDALLKGLAMQALMVDDVERYREIRETIIAMVLGEHASVAG
jgi:TetR/AcrR family transcriptional regulator, transcriptional repressor of bet genes